MSFAYKESDSVLDLNSSSFSRDMIPVINNLLGWVNSEGARNFRLVVNIMDDGKVKPCLELDPLEHWDLHRANQTAPSPTTVGQLRGPVSEDYVSQVTGLVSIAKQYVVKQMELHEDESNQFKKAVSLTGNAIKFRSKFKEAMLSVTLPVKCNIVTQIGISQRTCEFSCRQELIVTKALVERPPCNYLEVLRSIEKTEPCLLIIGAPSSIEVHSNEEMIQDVNFWTLFAMICLRLYSAFQSYPVHMALNFGRWESEIARNTSVELETCHPHAHIRMPLDMADQLGLHNGTMHLMPKLYRDANVQAIRQYRLDYCSSLVAQRLERIEAENRYQEAENRHQEAMRIINRLTEQLSTLLNRNND